jgi:glycine hydroxymethyltransferase
MATNLNRRGWVPAHVETLVQTTAARTAESSSADVQAELDRLIKSNRQIHEVDCINLNPATNVMNPRAEAALAAGLGSRPSLGYPGEKYEMGLEAIEQVEIIAAELAAEIFGANYAEIRVGSGALGNLYSFMAFASPGDTIIVPPPTVGGHVTHQNAGAAGLYGLDIHDAPIDAAKYTIDPDGLAELARALKPAVITVGASLNLTHHPVAAAREIADEVGAKVLFDAAHLSGPIAGGVWPNPLDEGAHAMSMSTYKSLGGPPSGLVVTNDADVAERLDAIAYPGLTANFDAAKSAALAITLLDWRDHGAAYGSAMLETAAALEAAVADRGGSVFGSGTQSHAFALDASEWGGGHAAALRLREANLLTCAIGLPHDAGAGLRIGTNEVVRWGMTSSDMPALADLIMRGLDDPATVAADTKAMRSRFTDLHFIN